MNALNSENHKNVVKLKISIIIVIIIVNLYIYISYMLLFFIKFWSFVPSKLFKFFTLKIFSYLCYF